MSTWGQLLGRVAHLGSDSASTQRPKPRIALLTLQGSSDRFLEDRKMALVSGRLRDAGVPNEMILALWNPVMRDEATEAKLIQTLRDFDIILFEQVRSTELLERIRAAVGPEKTFVFCHGKHVPQNAPYDWICTYQNAEELLAYLCGLRPKPPPGARKKGQREGPSRFRFPLFRSKPEAVPTGAEDARPWRPNLHPIIINPEALPQTRAFAIVGNQGCPYQADARLNPVYAGVQMPEGMGRGCAFCTAGNNYTGAPNAVTAAFVVEQIKYIRHELPDLNHLFLEDQNPFGYLREVVEAVEREQVPPFTLFVATRVDWFLNNAQRFESALTSARRSGMVLALFLVGIENFSQAELDRMNKGMKAEQNLRFMDMLWDWQKRYAPAFTLDHTGFGFMLFTPWTTMADLRANYLAIRRTQFHKIRGGALLSSRAQLYPGNAMYYLAERDGLLAEQFSSVEEGVMWRFGSEPPKAWRFKHADVAHFAALSAEAGRGSDGPREIALFHHLLAAFAEAGSAYASLTPADVLKRRQVEPTPDPARLPELPATVSGVV